MEVGKKRILNEFIWGNNSTQFVIPIYQRNYVWKKENVQQLMNDIENMIKYIDDSSIFHFFGSVVYIDSLHRWFFQEFSIIDWQQRLTTIFLLLHALRIIYPEADSIISETYLYNREAVVNKDDELTKYKLKPLVTDDNMYLKISKKELENLTEDEENSNIYKMFCIIKKILSWRKEKYSFEEILSAIDKFTIVWIQLWSNENPQQVFESINSTWVNLTAADLIRNFILMNKNDKEQTRVYKDYWEKIEFHHVWTDNLKEFFRFYVSIKKKDTISEREVYDLFKKEYESLCNESGEDAILQDILDYAEVYWYIKNENSPIRKIVNSDKIESCLKDFRNIDTNMPILLLMETLRLYLKGRDSDSFERKISEEDVCNTINLLTNYIVRRNLCWAETRYISWHFGMFLGRIENIFYEWTNFYESALKVIVLQQKNLWSYMPDDSMLEEAFNKNDLYHKEMTAFVLKRIESNMNNVSIDYKSLNIEHVMPQHKTEYWEKQVLEWSVYEEVLNRIWNLTLVASKDNSAMSNKDFESKKKVLEKTNHIKMNVEIMSSTEWNENKIKERGNKLLREFINIFPFPKVEDELNWIDPDTIYHYKKVQRTDSRMKIINWKFVVLEWSKLSPQITSNIESVNKYRKKHAKYINDELVTTKDIEFDTPSGAGQFVYWASSAWWDEWVDNNWNSLNDNIRKKK